MFRTCLFCLSFVSTTLVSTAADAVSDSELRFLDALRGRQLNHLLELQCERLLARQDLSPQVRSRYAIELAEILSQRAARTLDGAARQALWTRADGLFESFIETNPKYDKLPLFRYQFAGQLIDRAQLMADLAKVLPDDPVPAKASREAATKAVSLLTGVLQDLQAATEAPAAKGAGMDAKEIYSLQNACKFRLGGAWLAIARVETEAEQRSKAVASAESELKHYGNEYSSLPIVLESHLALAELYELAGRSADAIAVLKRLERSETPKNYLARADLQLSRLLLATGEVDKALVELDVPEGDRVAGAEWSLLLFEALMRQGAQLQPTDEKKAEEMQNRAFAILDALESKYGSYWGRRGEQVLAQYGKFDQVGDNLMLLRRLAGVQRSQKKPQQAIETCDRAVELAKKSREPEIAGQMAYAAGMIALDIGEFPDAARRLVGMAKDYPDNKLAPQALLAAASAWAKQNAKDNDAASLTSYRQVLETHLKKHGDDPATASEVHWLLAELAERDRKPDEAIAHYLAVPAADKRYASSLEALAGIYHDRFTLLTDSPQPVDAKQLQGAIDYLERAVSSDSAALAESPAGARALATVRFVLARLLSLPAVGRDADAVAILRDQVTTNPALPAGFRSRAWQALLELQTQRGDVAGAEAVARSGFADDFAAIFRALAGLAPTAETLEANQRAAQVAFIEGAAKRVLASPEKLTPRDRLNIRLLLAQAYAAKGDHANAQNLLKRLQADAPRDPRIVMALFASQFASGSYADSLKTSNIILKGAPRGGPEWMAAMYNMIACYHALGQDDKARQYLNLTKTLYPQLGGAPLNAKFAELEKQLSK